MRQDLGQKVSATIARFDTAVQESCTRRHADPNEDGSAEEKLRLQDGRGRELDLAERIAAEVEGKASPPSKPLCRPWDYEAFTSRLGTFTPLNWFSKPALASPPECARYGWVNTGRNILSCQCCNAQLYYCEDVPSNDSTSSTNKAKCGVDGKAAARGGAGGGVAVAQSLMSFSSRLKFGHHDLCPWRGNACPVEFLQLPPLTNGDLLKEFFARLDSLVAIMSAKALPEVTLPDSFEQYCSGGLATLAAKTRVILNRRSSRQADTDAIAGTSPGGAKRRRPDQERADTSETASVFGDEVLGTAAAIAVFGWRSAASTSGTEGLSLNGDGVGDDNVRALRTTPHRLFCAFCNRRLVADNFLGLEFGQPLDPGNGEGECPVVGSPGCRQGSGRSGKRRRLSGGGTPLKPMHLAIEHRSFCPWAVVHPPVEGEAVAGDYMPGWRQSLEALLISADPVEQVSSRVEETEGFGEAANDKADEALYKVQKVLGVLMRY